MKFKANSIYVMLGFSVFLTLGSTAVTYYNTLEKERNIATIARRYKSINAAGTLLSLLQDMETGTRGYVISGDADFLEPYNSAKAQLSMAIATLQVLVSDNDQQNNLVSEAIVVGIEKKSSELTHVIGLVNSLGRTTAQERISTKIGKARMDTLRVLVGDLVARENKLLEIQNEILQKNTRIEDTVRFLAFGLIAVTSIVAMVRFRVKQRNIQTLVHSLEDANKTLEERVQTRTAELVRANDSKNHFLGIASHDLKVPIVGVLGLIRLMKDEDDTRSDSDKEYLNYMESACQGMHRLIINLLDINRIDSGKTQITKTPVQLESVLTKIKTDFGQRAKVKGIKLEVEPTDIRLFTDPDLIERVLCNLVSNAIKFSKAGTTVFVKTSIIEDTITIKVTDQGPGVPSDEIKDLFVKFARLTNKPTSDEESTGLGLSIVKELIELLGGKITVESEVGVGSTFQVSLQQS